ncbi:MAG: type II toxin-antitoxin system RelE/ParE family toxin [Candidatus Parabeggiatoa sp.]|nr:type II toxin-antitoxin system RelE/ParE family toxin [Candidatus Parabeggiatoa sp.]
MIKSFLNNHLEDLFYDDQSKGLNRDHLKKLERILDRLNESEDISDMRYPGSELHKLEPKKDNRWAVSVNGNWRVTFIFKEENVYEVDYGDYH